MAISLKSLSSGAVFWEQDSLNKSDEATSTTVSDGTITINEECLIQYLYVRVNPASSVTVEVFRNSVSLGQRTFSNGQPSNSLGFRVIGGTGDVVPTSAGTELPPSPPMYCKDSFSATITTATGTGGRIDTGYTTGSYQPIF